jgi:hypothetical protein
MSFFAPDQTDKRAQPNPKLSQAGYPKATADSQHSSRE